MSALALVAVTAAFAWLVVVYPARPGPGSGDVVAIELPSHEPLDRLAERLFAEGLIRQPWLFRAYALAMGAGTRLRSGPILLRDDMSPRVLLQRIGVGYGQTSLRITLPEGFNRFDVADRLHEWDVVERTVFLEATEDPTLLADLGVPADNAEGYLFPDTYHFLDRSGPDAVLGRLVRTGQRRVDKLLQDMEAQGGRPTAAEQAGLDREGIITLASIVEKEAAVPEEQPIIAGVFLNRLRDPAFQPKRLQADPTVAYGCFVMRALVSCQGFDGKRVTRQMTQDANNLYNTYRHAGLPPGPISNPGLSAIRAVLSPAEHDYLYFVARGRGRHRFSKTLQEHNEAVEALRRLQ